MKSFVVKKERNQTHLISKNIKSMKVKRRCEGLYDKMSNKIFVIVLFYVIIGRKA